MNDYIDITESMYKKFFPYKKKIKYQNLKMTKESVYSMDLPYQHDIMLNIIKLKTKKPLNKLTITDATSNVGGATLFFANNFNHINAVEINPIHCLALKNNLDIYKLSQKVNIICDDYLAVGNRLKQDVLYFDPPWGGKNYRDQKYMDLFLGKKNIIDIINEVTNTSLIILKIPVNYNLKKMIYKIKSNNICIYKVHSNKLKYLLVTISLDFAKQNPNVKTSS